MSKKSSPLGREFKLPILVPSEGVMSLFEGTNGGTFVDIKLFFIEKFPELSEKFESGFKFHVKEAMNKGATKEEIIEVLLLLLIYCEVPSFLKALWWAKDLGVL